LFSVAVPIGGGSLKQTEISFETGEKGFNQWDYLWREVLSAVGKYS
jgi:hypothetical protein